MESKVKHIITDILIEKGTNPKDKEISLTTNLRSDLGLDSFDLAQLTVLIEAEFNVDIFQNQIISTVGEIMEVLANK